MQRDVEMQIRGVEAQVKGQGEAMMKVLQPLKKRDRKKRNRKRKKKARKWKAGGDQVDVGSGCSSSSSSQSS